MRKTIKLSAIALATMAISACSNSNEAPKVATDSIPAQDTVEVQKIDSFLITNTKAGLFCINDTIGNLIKAYGYTARGYSDWVYTENDDVELLPNTNSVLLKDGEPYLKIGHPIANFKEGEEPAENDKHYLVRDMRDGKMTYLYKDSICDIEIKSEKFKTKEGIGIGSTFKDLQKNYKDIEWSIDMNPNTYAIYAFVSTKDYPNILFQMEPPVDELVDVDPKKVDPNLKIIGITITSDN